MNLDACFAIAVGTLGIFGFVALIAFGAFKQDPVSCKYTTINRDSIANVRCYNDATGRRVSP